MLVTKDEPCVVYWKERTCAWVKGHWLATGMYYELYDREQKRFVDAFRKACIFPSRVEAEALAAQHPKWEVMTLVEAETLFSREGDRRP